MFRTLLAVAALALTASAAASSAPPRIGETHAASHSDAPAAIGFNPPLERTLRYRMAKAVASSETMTVVMTVRFSRRGDAYRMTTEFELPPEVAGNPALALLRKPVVLDVDAGGAIVAMADEEAWLSESEQLVRTLIGRNPNSRVLMERMMSQIRALPAEARLEFLSQNQQPLLLFAATDLRVGETSGRDVTTPTALGTLERVVTVSFDSVEQGIAKLTVVQRFSPEQLAAVVSQIQSNFAPANRSFGLSGNISGERRDRFQVDVASGLTTRYTSTMEVRGTPEGAVTRQVMLLERLPD